MSKNHFSMLSISLMLFLGAADISTEHAGKRTSADPAPAVTGVNMVTDKAISLTPFPFYVAGRGTAVTVTVDNTSTTGGGPFDDEMTVTGEVSSGLMIHEITPDQGVCEILEAGFSCNLGTVAAHTVVNIIVIVLAELPGTETFSATVESSSFDPDNSNNSAMQNIEVLQPASISGQKYHDLNANGTKDPDEPGIGGWSISLNGLTNGIIDQASTSGDGTYNFDLLPPGDYEVTEQDSNFWFHSTPSTLPVGLEEGEAAKNIDFGNYQLGSVSGQKYEDLNGNGMKDEGEPAIEGWTIFLEYENAELETISESMSTDENGNFLFTNITPRNDYMLSESEKTGWVQAEPATAFYELEVTSGQTIESRNFGNYRPASISGTKWQDDNGNGVKDTGEDGLSNWVITLAGTDGAGNAVNRDTTTDANGNFLFTGLSPGTYTVSENLLTDWHQSFPAAPGTHTVTLQSGQLSDGNDFGNIPPGVELASIHGKKFYDANGNAQQDPGEVGIDGFKIELLDNAGALAATTSSMSMDLNGNGSIDPETEQGLFWFKDLLPGNYTVREVIPGVWVQTFPPAPGTYAVTLEPGDIYDGALFGNTMDDVFDWGDLPQPADTTGLCALASCYPTKGLDGARHALFLGSPYLGADVDPEGDGKPTIDALGDDADNKDDEDGVTFGNITPGGTGSVEIEVSALSWPVYVTVWIDFNGDGILGDLVCGGTEKVVNGAAIPAPATGPVATQAFEFNVPDEVSEPGYARVRVSSNPFAVFCPFGIAVDGEVEDYVVGGADFGDAPNESIQDMPLDFPIGYPTTLAEDGARHVFESTTRLGDALTDGEGNGQPDKYAAGDDHLNRSDEDGIEFGQDSDSSGDWVILWKGPDPDGSGGLTLRGMVLGTTVTVKPLATKSGFIDAWVDWNRDGDWEDGPDNDLPEEKVIDSEPVESGPDYTEITFDVPADASVGWTFARFRYSAEGDLDFTGAASSGEVEDYILAILLPLDFGDAPEPYQTLALHAGARHVADGQYYLGASADFEYDGAPSDNALGDDDFDGNDDEDGIVFLSGLETGNTVEIEVTANTPPGTPGMLNAWIDFNADGDWDDEGEQIFTDVELSAGSDTLDFEVPEDAAEDSTFARFRFDETGGTSPADSLLFPDLSVVFTSGEVEDYLVVITGGPTSAEEELQVPSEYSLYQNYPNPFNPVTTITYDVAKQGAVVIKVYDVLGKVQQILVNKVQSPGQYLVRFNAANLSSGIYFYEIRSDEFRAVKKMILLK